MTADVAVTPDVVTAPAEPAMVTVDVYEVVASVAYRLSEVARDLPDHSRVGDGRVLDGTRRSLIWCKPARPPKR